MINIYAGTFLIALSSLALEVVLTRLLSVISYYHMAFFAVSTAMLGMTAGAITVYLNHKMFLKDKLHDAIAAACILFAVSVPLTLWLLCSVPISGSYESGVRDAVSKIFLKGLLATLFCIIPFYFSGVAIAAILTKQRAQINKLYASDLIGASIGCLVVLFGLEFISAPGFILLSGSIGALAAVFFVSKSRNKALRITAWIVLFGAIGFTFVNQSIPNGIRPRWTKGRIEDPKRIIYEKWNSYSRVTVFDRDNSLSSGAYWGPSPKAPDVPLNRYQMVIDGEASTYLAEYKPLRDMDFFKYDLTNLVYFLRPSGGALIIGSGGGRDILSALVSGHQQVRGIELNSIIVNLVKERFSAFSGLANRPGVDIVVDDARSYLARDRNKYKVIQMALIDTWASTGAGGFTLSENGLYTREAWKVFLNRLEDDGIFTVSRWYNPQNIGEAGRVLGLAVAALIDRGVKEPSKHIALATVGPLSTLLLSAGPLTEEDVNKIKAVCGDLGYELKAAPGMQAATNVFSRILSSKSLKELNNAVKDEPLNYRPTSDDSPYFFNMLKLDHINYALRLNWITGGVIKGNLVANITLLILIACLLIFAVITIILPLAINRILIVLRKRGRLDRDLNKISWSAAAYFSLIGAGFMLAEIALVQKLSVFLGHPVYALGVLLFTMIASAGVGSLISERLPLIQKPWVNIYPIAIGILLMSLNITIGFVSRHIASSPVMGKIFVSILIIMPAGTLMGMCFPAGIKLIGSSESEATPWYWALNGVFGVLFSALAVCISIYSSISVSIVISALCYFALVPCVSKMGAKSEGELGT